MEAMEKPSSRRSRFPKETSFGHGKRNAEYISRITLLSTTFCRDDQKIATVTSEI